MNANPTTTAVTIVRERARSGGTIGWRTRACTATKVTIAATARMNAPTTRLLVNPTSPASIAPYVRAAMAVTPLACPAQSSGTRWWDERPARASRSSATAPTGTFTRKIHRQLASVSTPPRIGPHEEATAPPIAQIATALVRRAGSGYDCPIKAIEDGIITAAAVPCTNRNTTRAPRLGASPQAAEARTKASTPNPNARLAPSRSVRDPDDNSSPANISV